MKDIETRRQERRLRKMHIVIDGLQSLAAREEKQPMPLPNLRFGNISRRIPIYRIVEKQYDAKDFFELFNIKRG